MSSSSSATATASPTEKSPISTPIPLPILPILIIDDEDEDDTFKCNKCGQSVDKGTQILGIELTRACVACLTKNQSMITKKDANLKISTKTLATLNSTLVRNPYVRRRATMYQFFELEVDMAKEEEDAVAAKISTDAVQARDARISSLKFSPQDIPLDLHASILGDYNDVITKNCKPKTSMTKVVKAQKVLDLAVNVSELVKIKMAPLGFGTLKNDMRATVFSFCLRLASVKKRDQVERNDDDVAVLFVNTQKLRREVLFT